MEQILAKLRQIAENPGYYKGLTPEEQAELFLLLLTPKKKVFQKPKVIQGIDGKDGETPVKDKDYLSKESSLAVLDEIRAEAQKTLKGIEPIKGKDGKDAQITPDLIEKIVTEAVKRVPLPRFPIETTQIVLENQDDIAFIKSEIERLEELTKKESRQFSFGGGVSKATVLDLIAQNQSSGANWTYYATKWDSAPTVNTTITGGTVYNYILNGVIRYRFVPTTYSPSEDAFYSSFSNPTLSGLITARNS
jgi:hypothetical protein